MITATFGNHSELKKNEDVEKTEGIKDSLNKLMTLEIDSRFQKEMMKVMTVNKNKYPRGNKYEKIDIVLLFEAMERHLLAVKESIQYGTSIIDEEDGCNHLAKIATNADMLFVQLEKLNDEDKDRTL